MKNKLIILVCSICLLQNHANSQTNKNRYNLSGTVATKENTPLAGASVYIPDLKKGDIADQNGHYLLKNIPGGTYLVEVKFIGYETILQTVYFDKPMTRDFAMKISVTEENEIVITGSSKATSLRRNPVPIVSVNKKYLTQNLNTNIIDAIATVPGVSAVTTGPNVSKPFIRGLGFNRILTLYDGIRQEGQQWGDEHGVEVDQNTVGKVEIVKGPASLIYGSDAIAGVVNLLPPATPAEGNVKGNISSEYQTNNGLSETSANVAAHTGSWTWGGIATHKMATNYRNKYDGRVYNTGFREMNFSAYAGLHKNWGYSRLGVSLFNSLQEIPSGKRDSASRKFEKPVSGEDDIYETVSVKELRSYDISDQHQHVQHLRIYNASSFILGRDRLGVNIGFQKSIRKEFEEPKDPALHLDLNTLTYDVRYFFHESKGFSLSGGVNGMYQQNKADKGYEFIIPSYNQFDIGGFVFGKKTAGKLEIAGGLRFDTRNFKNSDLYVSEDPVSGKELPVFGKDTTGAEHLFTAFDHLFSGFSGSAGISYLFSDKWSIKLNVGQGYRAPNISEISSNGVHSGTRIFQLGNKNIKPEFNTQYDLGITYNTEHVTINGNIFSNNIRNYIYNQKLLNAAGEDSVIVPGNETFQYVASRARITGGEFMIDIHPHPLDWLHFENSISLVYALNKGQKGKGPVSADEKYLPLIPPVHTKSELRGAFDKAGKYLADAFVKVQYEIYGRQNRAYLQNGTETPTPGYSLLNGGLGANILNKKCKVLFELSFMANNILNTTYQSNMNRLKYFEDYPANGTGRSGIYNMGRNFSIRINVPVTIWSNN